MLAAPSSALAAGAKQCEVNGQMFCITTADLQLETVVTEGTSAAARTIIVQPLGTKFEGKPTALLELASDATKCIAATNAPALNVKIHPCSGGSGTVWAQELNFNGNTQWINRYATQNDSPDPGFDFRLAGNNNGTGYILAQPFANSTKFFNFNTTTILK
jgi:hypothetical protein